MYGVVLVDDEQIILQGLQRVFPWADYNLRVLGAASDGKEGLALIRQLKPDIVLTDIRMPNMDGLAMLAALGSEFPCMEVSVLTAYRDFDYAKEAMRLGVCRYLLKPSKMDELKEAFAFMTQSLDRLSPTEKEAERDNGEAGGYVTRAALQYIKEHFEEHITLSDVAEHVYVSPWHLSKLINRQLNQSFFDIVNGLRIDRAKELLGNPALKVNEIAIGLGFGDVAHFSKNFKKATGKSPMEFRQG